MSNHRKNSVRDKVIGEKWIYLERYIFHTQNLSQKARMATGHGVVLESESGQSRNILHRQTVGHLRRQEARKYEVVSFLRAE